MYCSVCELVTNVLRIVSVSGRGDVSHFFNTQMVLDLNGKSSSNVTPVATGRRSHTARQNDDLIKLI